jgi:hypothetical protein
MRRTPKSAHLFAMGRCRSPLSPATTTMPRQSVGRRPEDATGSRQSTSRTGRCVRVSSEVSRCSERPRLSSASTFTRSRGCADYGFWRAFRLPAKSEPALSPKPRPFWRHIWRPLSRSVPALQPPCRLKLLTPRFPPLLAYITMATCPDLAQSVGE